MKSLYAALAVCLCLPLQAEVLVDTVTFESDWPSTDLEPFLFLIDPGEHSCPGGTLPLCEDANMSLTRGLEIFSCVGNSDPPDPRVEGTVWIQINGNFDMDGTGPGWGVFMLVPGESCDKDSLIHPEVYWEGSWEGKREKVSEVPEIWVHTIEVVGHGVGGYLEGQKIRATELLTSYTQTAIPNEFLSLDEPESVVTAEIKSKDK